MCSGVSDGFCRQLGERTKDLTIKASPALLSASQLLQRKERIIQFHAETDPLVNQLGILINLISRDHPHGRRQEPPPHFFDITESHCSGKDHILIIII